MYQHLGAELNRSRMDQRMREAEAYRLGAQTRAGRTAGHHATFRKVATAAVHILVWPIRH